MRPPAALASAGLQQPGNLVLPPPLGSLGPAAPQRLPLQCFGVGAGGCGSLSPNAFSYVGESKCDFSSQY